jgi:KipI family sensor histidine kinase inhibitor
MHTCRTRIRMATSIDAASDHSLLVSFGNEISIEIHRKILRLVQLLRDADVLNIHPAYASILVTFDPRRRDHATLEREIRGLLDKAAPLPEPRLVEIPVCYGGEFGPDLADVARMNHLANEEVIRTHSSADYLVYFLGFAPGFPYLGGMPEAISTPRLAVPRTQVPAGSVAIGGSQTGIYPVASPGGWRIIGRTPLELFRADRDPLTLLRMGDHVCFVPISKEQFG